MSEWRCPWAPAGKARGGGGHLIDTFHALICRAGAAWPGYRGHLVDALAGLPERGAQRGAGLVCLTRGLGVECFCLRRGEDEQAVGWHQALVPMQGALPPANAAHHILVHHREDVTLPEG